AQLLGQPEPRRRRHSRHSPGKDPAPPVAAAAFAKARQRMPSAFWVALVVRWAEKFQRLHGAVVGWRRCRRLALAGTGLARPDRPALRAHFGTPSNAGGSHGAQARRRRLRFPLARRPDAHLLAPWPEGETRLARQVRRGLRPDDLMLLDAGFLGHGLL